MKTRINLLTNVKTDGQTTVKRQSTDGQSQRHYTLGLMKYAAMITLLLTLACGQMWGGETILKEIDFTTATWSGTTFSQGNTTTPDVINGITFYAKNSSSSSNFSYSTDHLVFPGNNYSSSNYVLGFPITGIVDGMITIRVWNGTTAKAFKYNVIADATEFASSHGDGTAATTGVPGHAEVGGINATKAYVYIGCGNTSDKNVTKIVVSTPARTSLSSSSLYESVASTSKTVYELINGASYPDYFATTISAVANRSGWTSSVSTPHDYTGVDAKTSYYFIKAANGSTITLRNLSNVKSVRFYGNGDGTAANITTSVSKVTGSGSNFSVSNIAFDNSNKVIAEYTTGDMTGLSGYNAATYYNYTFTFGGAFDLWGIYVETASAASTYTVTYDANGGTGTMTDSDSPYEAGATVTVLENEFTKTGYTFDGWNTAANMSGTSYAAAGTFSISTNTTLYAKWKQTITLDDEDATTAVSPTSVTAYYNSATLPSITNPEKTGYMFAGWYTGDDGTGDLVINTSGELQANVSGYTGEGGIWTSSSARTLYAKWVEAEYEDKIVWAKSSDYGGDGKCMSSDDANSTAKDNNDKNDIGHSYVQISSTNTGMRRPANVDDVFSVTFTAKDGYYIKSICTYGKIEEGDGADYSWDGGSNWTNIAKYTTQATKTFDAPDATEPTSFIIKYTCTNTGSGGIYWRNAVVTLGETAPTYTVTYDANGGTGTMTDSYSPYEAGATVTVLENEFTKPGYPFTGWSAVDAEDTEVTITDGTFTMPSSNVTITAQWGDALVDTFKDLEHGSEEGHGGSSGLTRSGANKTTPTLKNTTPVNEYCNDLHYKFIGWVKSTSVNDDGTLKSGAEIVPGGQSDWVCTGSTYYAVWAAKNE